MSWHLVAGVPLPDPVGGHPVLDFCNTRAGWGSPRPKEYLVSYRALTLWSREAGLLDEVTAAALLDGVTVAARPDGVTATALADDVTATALPDDGRSWGDRGDPAAEVLTAAIALREALYRAALGSAEPAGWTLLSAWAIRARAASLLVPGADGPPARWRPAAPRPGDDPVSGPAAFPVPELPLLAVAAAAAAFLTSPAAGTVGACPGTGCGWLFTDPRHRRRWCSMAVCGNRAKARRHAQRRCDPAPPHAEHG